MLLAGANDGVYRAAEPRFDDAERVLDSDRAMRVRRFDGWDGVFAATTSGLYRSTDGGDSWTDLSVPREEVYSVLGDPAGERLYAGTHPAHLYVSDDEGETWRELEGFQDLPSREEWHTPRHRDEAHVRSLRAHPDAPGRVVAGVEVGGVHVSDDGGETWTERKRGVHDDVHHVLLVGPDEYVASTGNGLYRTTDAGRTWTRLDGGLDRRYFREAFVHDGRFYAAAARSSPGTWRGERGADAALFEADAPGSELRPVRYPGEPEAVVLAWTAHDGAVVAGTNDGDVLVRTDGEWVDGGRIRSGVRSLCVTA
ncbi:WD40/YVTN/BNR-like repeat-containing protein [Halorussus halobius]|uniref:WD40/YVTN/BNR-like repeat-containing protein n=1 Tax=Halorussus halobius TaxID=1710537 RepID=UPI00109233BE|nr:glycosyl hydrolase [Halorussus halobius]